MMRETRLELRKTSSPYNQEFSFAGTKVGLEQEVKEYENIDEWTDELLYRTNRASTFLYLDLGIKGNRIHIPLIYLFEKIQGDQDPSLNAKLEKAFLDLSKAPFLEQATTIYNTEVYPSSSTFPASAPPHLFCVTFKEFPPQQYERDPTELTTKATLAISSYMRTIEQENPLHRQCQELIEKLERRDVSQLDLKPVFHQKDRKKAKQQNESLWDLIFSYSPTLEQFKKEQEAKK